MMKSVDEEMIKVQGEEMIRTEDKEIMPTEDDKIKRIENEETLKSDDKEMIASENSKSNDKATIDNETIQDVKFEDNKTDALNDEAHPYTKSNEYTSEIYKIEINNIPKFLNHGELKKLFKNKFKLAPKKVKVVGNPLRKNSSYAFVTFANEEQREKAIALANNFVFKKCKLKVFKAKPAPDPSIRWKNQDSDDKINYDEFSEDDLQQLLFNQICPLWSKGYDCQLQEKQDLHKRTLNDLLYSIETLYKSNQNDQTSLANYLDNQLALDSIYENIRAVKEQPSNYRNKCEFSIGKNGTVGFRLGSYRDNNIKVVKPINCPLLNDKMVKSIDLFEKFIKISDLEIYDLYTHQGNLKQITVRTTKEGCMLILELDRYGLDEAKLKNEIDKLKLFVQNEADYVNSLYVKLVEKQMDESKKSDLLTHLSGDLYLIEKMKNDEFQFRISPQAFFQVNTRAAEILYETISDLADLNKNVIVLDICSGVGTIGIYLANKVKFVLAVELNDEAVNDAIHNAELNNIKNIRFYKGMAEDNLFKMITKAKQIDSMCSIIAILDPARAGLKNSIIKLIRNCNDITNLIYVSCEIKYSRQNLIDLSRPTSKSYQGKPFHLTKALAVDMFPHTKNCELVTLFTREYVKRDFKKQRIDALDEVSCLIDGNASKVGCNVDTINIGNDNVEEERKINEIDEKEIRMEVKKEQMNIEEAAAVKPETILNCNRQINIDEKEVKKIVKDVKMVNEKDA